MTDAGTSQGSSDAVGVVVTDHPDRLRYEVELDGCRVGLVTYTLRSTPPPGRITYLHTEIDDSVSGRGIGGALARFVLEDARTRGLTVVPRCPFIAGYIDRHPEYAALVDET